MNRFDFLSRSPNALIFGLNSNKTNLGGVFTSIYLLLVLIITFIYIYDYSVNPKYSTLYTTEHKYIDESEMLKRLEDENLNPEISFNFRIPFVNENNFFIQNSSTISFFNNIIEFGVDYKNKIFGLSFALIYNCLRVENNTCVIREEDKGLLSMNNNFLSFNYTGYKIDHQNGDTPLQKVYLQDAHYFNFDSNKLTINYLKWKHIKYTKEKGIFATLKNLMGESNDLYGGEFITPQKIVIDTPELLLMLERLLGYKTLAFFIVNIYDNQSYFDYYLRSKISIFDSISNICSLSLTVYNIMTFLFCGYYSNSFDNYKIIDNIIFKNQKRVPNKNLNEYSNKAIELSSDFDKKENLINTNSNNVEENIIIEKNENEKDFDCGETKEKEKIISHQDTRILPKLHFYDFIFNNIYNRKCCLSKKQEIINSCNEIISEYFTIDNIIYNQMRLENLFKDYKWNNPKLNSIGNNKLNYLFENYE